MTEAVSSHRMSGDRTYLPWAAAALVASAVVIILGNTNLKPGENGSTGWLFVNLAIFLVLAYPLFGMLVPGSTNPARTGLIFGILSIISLGAFWSALPVLLGPVAFLLGRRAGDVTQGKVAVWLGAIATVVGFVGGVALTFT